MIYSQGVVFTRLNALSNLSTILDVLDKKAKDSSDVLFSIRSDENNMYLDISFNNFYGSVVTLTFEQSSNLPY